MSRVTQTAIARHLGISRSAVAAVLSRSPAARISPELRERILTAANQLGYIPNRFAQIMSKGRSGMIGIINFGGQEQLPYQKVLLAVSQIIKAGYEPVVDNSIWFADHGKSVCARMIQMQVEGVALIHPPPSFTRAHLKRLLDANIPVVILGGGLSGVTRYLSDKEEGFYALTRHLLDSGYRRLTLLIGRDSTLRRKALSWHGGNAEKGFLKALHEQPPEAAAAGDVSIFNHQITPPRNGTISSPYEPGYFGMQEILARPVLPEVVLCSNDSWAIGALAACADADVKVPDELAITGFENDPVSRFGLLPLTTVSHPVVEIVHSGIPILLEAIRTGVRTPDIQHIVPGKLIVRQSCGSHLRHSSSSHSSTASLKPAASDQASSHDHHH